MSEKSSPASQTPYCKNKDWQNFADELPIPIIKIALNSNYNIISANTAFSILTEKIKLVQDENKWTTPISFLHPDDIPIFTKTLQDSYHHKKTLSVECRMVKQNKSIIWIQVQCQTAEPYENTPVMQCCISEITKWKVQRTTTPLDNTLSLLPGGLLENSDSYHLISYNDALTLITGYSYTEYLTLNKKRRYNLVCPDDRMTFSIIIYKLKKMIPFQSMYRIICKTGAVKMLHIVGEWYGNNKETQYFQCIVTDTTSNRNTQILFDIQKNGSLYRSYGRTTTMFESLFSPNHADHDTLTGFYTYKAAKKLMHEFLKNEPDYYHIIMIIRIHQLEKIRAQEGFLQADIALLKSAITLQLNFRKTDIIGRMGRNQFIILMRDIPCQVFSPIDKARQLKNLLKATYKYGERTINVSADIGIAVHPMEGEELNSLLNLAIDSLERANEIYKRRQANKK